MDVEVGSRVITDYGHGEVTEIGRKGIRTAYRIVGSEYDVWLSGDEFDLLDFLFGDEPEPENEELSILDLEADPDEDINFIKEGEDPEFESEFIDRANDNPELADLEEGDLDTVFDVVDQRVGESPYAVVPEVVDEVIDELEPVSSSLSKDAAWVDVQNKAREIYATGRVSVNSLEDRKIEAVVEGATGTYNTMIKKTPGSQKIAFWSCSCPWGECAFKRETRYGRLCSHALATQYAMQSMEYGRSSSCEDEDVELTVDDSYNGEDEWLFQSDLQTAIEADTDDLEDP